MNQMVNMLIFWSQNDIFFTLQGGEAYLMDRPNAQIHRLDSGHFAVEDSLDYIAENIHRFYDEKVAVMEIAPMKKNRLEQICILSMPQRRKDG